MAEARPTDSLAYSGRLNAKAIDRRASVLEGVAITASASTTAEIDMRMWAGGIIIMDASAAAVSFTFYVAEQRGGTYMQLYTTNNVAVALTVAASRAYPIPDECFGAHWLKIVGDDVATPDITWKG